MCEKGPHALKNVVEKGIFHHQTIKKKSVRKPNTRIIRKEREEGRNAVPFSGTAIAWEIPRWEGSRKSHLARCPEKYQLESSHPLQEEGEAAQKKGWSGCGSRNISEPGGGKKSSLHCPRRCEKEEKGARCMCWRKTSRWHGKSSGNGRGKEGGSGLGSPSEKTAREGRKPDASGRERKGPPRREKTPTEGNAGSRPESYTQRRTGGGALTPFLITLSPILAEQGMTTYPDPLSLKQKTSRKRGAAVPALQEPKNSFTGFNILSL